MRATGCDISKYQVRFQPQEIPDFVIQRVSYALRADEAFGQLYDDIQPVPVRGGYHYFSSGATWQAQADHYLELTHNCNYHFHNCDMETAYNNFNAGYVLGCIRWLDYVQKETKKPVQLYTNPSCYKTAQSLLSPTDLAMHDLWIAQYWFIPSPNKNPAMNGLKRDANDWKFYQYTSNGDPVPYGVKSASIDLDVFNGTVEELHQWAKINAPQPAPPTTDRNAVLDEAVAAINAIRE